MSLATKTIYSLMKSKYILFKKPTICMVNELCVRNNHTLPSSSYDVDSPRLQIEERTPIIWHVPRGRILSDMDKYELCHQHTEKREERNVESTELLDRNGDRIRFDGELLFIYS